MAFLLPFVFTSCKEDDTPQIQIIELIAQEKQDLIWLREEEKLARDVYTYAYNLYGEKTFTNVSSSEQRHMDEVQTLLEKYELTDPIVNDSIGVFSSAELRDLYVELTGLADSSLEKAFYVGATIEDLDLKDLSVFASNTTRADLLDTYNKLTCGSRNHMRAYYDKLKAHNVTYEAQYITATELGVIVNSEKEMCGH